MKFILEVWAGRWRHLRAWGRSLDEIKVEIKNRREEGSTGTAYPVRRSAVIRAGFDLPDALATILHEYAHLAAPGDEHHGLAWSERFSSAVKEVTSIAIAPVGRKSEIDCAATEAIRAWWRVSGNEFAAKLLLGRMS